MQACFASHYMAAMHNMHHLTDSMWGVASAARNPTAARARLASKVHHMEEARTGHLSFHQLYVGSYVVWNHKSETNQNF